MKKILKKIVKLIPEIITGAVIVAAVAFFLIATNELKADDLYDGNYVGGNSNHAYADINVEYIGSIEDIEGVETVEFSEKLEYKPFEQRAIIEYADWYLMDVKLQANRERYGYGACEYERVLICDNFDTIRYGGLMRLTIKDGVAYIDVTSKDELIQDKGYPASEAMEILHANIYFSNNGAVCYWEDSSYETITIYLERNGNLVPYNLQIMQIVMMGIVILAGLIYIIIAFFKDRWLHIWICMGLLLVAFIIMMPATRSKGTGEYRSVNNEEAFVMITEGEEYTEISGNIRNNIRIHTIENSAVPEFDTGSAEFKKEYKRFDVIPGYGSYAAIFAVDALAGAILGIISTGNMRKKSTVSEKDHYGKYKLTKIKYLSDAFAGMEGYFQKNLEDMEITFLPSYFTCDGEEISSPEYNMQTVKEAVVPGGVVEKVCIVTIMDDGRVVDHDLCFTKKSAYIRNKMDNMITIVYEISNKKG